jgi:predicted O-linked N-acetylglucosamine transferase (SPINDLY family)
MQNKINISPTPKQSKMMQKVLEMHQSGHLDLAETYYKKLLNDLPENTVLLTNFGTLQFQKKKLYNGIKIIERSLKIDPNQPNALNNLGVIFLELNQPNEALIRFDSAITFQANYAEAHSNRGNALNDLNRLKDALESYDRAILINPGYAKAHSNRGNVLKDLNRLNEALQSYDCAITLMPNYANAYSNRGDALRELNQLEKAIESYEFAIKLNPDIEFILGELFKAKLSLCSWSGLVDRTRKIKTKISNNEKASSPFSLLAVIDDPELQRQSAKIYVNAKYPKNNILPKIERQAKSSKIQIGYFSADFRDHAVSHLTANLYELHDREQFEIHAFSFGLDTKDEFNLRIKAGVDHYHDVRSLSDKDIVLLSRSEKIDIAVDLGGFTKNSRTGIFAMQAAPIQVNYLGYSGTMAADYIDYIIADFTIIPEDKKHHYAESIAYLPYSYMVTDSKIKKPTMQFTREGAGLPVNGFVFCCFNQHYKIAPTTFVVWMRILKQVEGSVLWLSEANSAIISNLKQEAIKNGVEGGRLIFAPRLTFKEDHLSRMKLANLFLDTLPYNAHTTCSDALQMGVPVLTCIGNSFTSRVAASLLNAVNLPELIATTQDQYESLAIKLSTNSEEFTSIKDKLVHNLSSAPLYDTQLFTQHLELAYIEMYGKYCKGIDPEDIYVKD